MFELIMPFVTKLIFRPKAGFLKEACLNFAGRLSAILAVIIFIVLSADTMSAEDVIRIIKPHSEMDRRHIYNNAILSAALEKTIPEYGDYKIVLALRGTQRDRALDELISGRNINVHIVPTRKKWEEKTIPIRIPIVKGLLGYRLFLIKRDNLMKFSSIKSLNELKGLRAGLRQQWNTTEAMKALGFRVVQGSNYEGLFHMLICGRFDYFPRGVNEIFPEFNLRSQNLQDMVIEPSKALYLPQPTYIFVSPMYSELAKRIEAGLRKMIQGGSFDDLFWGHHESSIQQAGLDRRQIFTVDNPLLSPKTPLEKKNLWLNLLAAPQLKTGVCSKGEANSYGR